MNFMILNFTHLIFLSFYLMINYMNQQINLIIFYHFYLINYILFRFSQKYFHLKGYFLEHFYFFICFFMNLFLNQKCFQLPLLILLILNFQTYYDTRLNLFSPPHFQSVHGYLPILLWANYWQINKVPYLYIHKQFM